MNTRKLCRTDCWRWLSIKIDFKSESNRVSTAENSVDKKLFYVSFRRNENEKWMKWMWDSAPSAFNKCNLICPAIISRHWTETELQCVALNQTAMDIVQRVLENRAEGWSRLDVISHFCALFSLPDQPPITPSNKSPISHSLRSSLVRVWLIHMSLMLSCDSFHRWWGKIDATFFQLTFHNETTTSTALTKRENSRWRKKSLIIKDHSSKSEREWRRKKRTVFFIAGWLVPN